MGQPGVWRQHREDRLAPELRNHRLVPLVCDAIEVPLVRRHEWQILDGMPLDPPWPPATRCTPMLAQVRGTSPDNGARRRMSAQGNDPGVDEDRQKLPC